MKTEKKSLYTGSLYCIILRLFYAMKYFRHDYFNMAWFNFRREKINKQNLYLASFTWRPGHMPPLLRLVSALYPLSVIKFNQPRTVLSYLHHFTRFGLNFWLFQEVLKLWLNLFTPPSLLFLEWWIWIHFACVIIYLILRIFYLFQPFIFPLENERCAFKRSRDL